MSQKKIQAVLFDIGETLLNFGKVDVSALFKEGGKLARNYLAELGKPVAPLHKFLSKCIWKIRILQAKSYLTNKDFDSLETLKKTGQKQGFNLSEQEWQQFAWLWYEPLSKFAKTEPDIKETLEKLRNIGLKLGILSNTFLNAATLEKHLAQFDIAQFFETKIYSYQFNFRKPDSRIFLEAAKRTGCRPENVLFVGDRLDLDIEGAKSAGMQTVLKKAYTNAGKKVPNGVITIEKINELPGVIEQMNSH